MRQKLKKKLSLLMALACTVACFNGTVSFAFDNGYNSAATYTNTVSSRITSASQVDWYKFEVTADEVPTSYGVTLKVPTDCMYNFDVRFRAANSTERPMVLENETIVSATKRRSVRGVLTEPGTYFVRVYSQNGSVDGDENYNLSISYGKDGTCAFTYENNLPESVFADWSVCATMLGKYTFGENIKYATNDRNYKNAYRFVTSNYTADNQTIGLTKATPEQTAIAADYVYSGDLMVNPKFKVETNKVYSIEELMYYLWALREPIIFYLTDSADTGNAYKKYIILKDVNIGENMISYYDPWIQDYETINYTQFKSQGILCSDVYVTYSGTNIIDSNAPRAIQAIYN